MRPRRIHILFLIVLMAALSAAGCTEPEEEAFSITEVQRWSLDPKTASFLNDMQRAYGQETYDVALALADSAARYAPYLADIPFLRGLIFSKLNRFDEAQAAYERVLELDPAYRSAWFNLGHNAFLQGQYRDALGFYQKEAATLDTSPEASPLLLQIGRAYARLGVPDSARRAYEQALAADSANAQAYHWLSELDAQAGELAQALDHARRALRLNPDHPEYRYGVGGLLFRTGAVEEAVGHLEAVVRQQPWHAGAHYNLGRALMTLGRRDEAQSYLKKADRLQSLNADIALAQLATFQYPMDPNRWAQLAALLGQAGRRDEARQAASVVQTLRSR